MMTRFPTRSLIASGLALSFGAASASAGTITYQPSVNLFQGTTTQDFVDTTGDLAVALNATNNVPGSVTVNGVTFVNAGDGLAATGDTATVTGSTGESITIVARGSVPTAFGDGEFTSDGDIFNLIAGAAFGVTDLNLAGLTIGQEYLLQIIVNDARGSRDTDFVTGLGGTVDSPEAQVVVNNSDPDGTAPDEPGETNAGDFILASFVADSTTVSIPVFSSGDGGATFGVGGGQAQINAVQLRAVPEPASLALIGLGSLALVARRKR